MGFIDVCLFLTVVTAAAAAAAAAGQMRSVRRNYTPEQLTNMDTECKSLDPNQKCLIPLPRLSLPQKTQIFFKLCDLKICEVNLTDNCKVFLQSIDGLDNSPPAAGSYRAVSLEAAQQTQNAVGKDPSFAQWPSYAAYTPEQAYGVMYRVFWSGLCGKFANAKCKEFVAFITSGGQSGNESSGPGTLPFPKYTRKPFEVVETGEY